MTRSETLKVLITSRVAAEFGQQLLAVGRKHGTDIRFAEYPGTVSTDADVAFFSRELFLGSSMNQYSSELQGFFDLLEVQENLRWIHLFSAGVDFAPVRRLLARGMTITTSSGANAIPMAQSVLAAVLAHSRGMPRWIAAQQRRQWEPAPLREWPVDLEGQTMVVVGMGPIGREIARLSKFFGLKVVAVRRQATELPPNCDEVHGPESLSALAPRTDWLVVAAPLTDETRGLVGDGILRLLPVHAKVINVGRGEIVDEVALAARLQAGQLGGAYLDVFAHEPLSASSPLWDIPNVIVSPHSAALSKGNVGRQFGYFLSNLDAMLAGAPMRNVVSGTPLK